MCVKSVKSEIIIERRYKERSLSLSKIEDEGGISGLLYLAFTSARSGHNPWSDRDATRERERERERERANFIIFMRFRIEERT